MIKWNKYCIDNNKYFYEIIELKYLIELIFCAFYRSTGEYAARNKHTENIVYIMKYFNIPIKEIECTCKCKTIFKNIIEKINVT
jgi:hypothetical protein